MVNRKNKICACLVFFILSFSLRLHAQKVDSTNINKGITQAVSYLNKRIETNQLYYLIAPLLIPIAEHYGLQLNNKLYNVAETVIDEKEREYFLIHNALFDYKERSKNFEALTKRNWEEIDGINLFALYCTRALPKYKFYALADSALLTTRYELTHVYLASLILKKTNCICNKRTRDLESDAWNKMKQIIPLDNDTVYDDLEVEVIALALYGGHLNSINDTHIGKLLALQKNEGYWSEDDTNSLFSDHTTVLALWALLEWKYKTDTRLYLPTH